MSLLDEIDDREDEGNIIIDADSLLFSSCYQFREDFDIELAYANFFERIGNIRTEAYNQVIKLNELKIAFSTKKNFRHKLYKDYKANRESTELSDNTKKLKSLIWERCSKIVEASNIWEADDIVIQYADKGWLISAIDKDVVNASPTKCYDYKKGKWNKPNTQDDIDRWYLIQSIAGDSSDNIKGVKGMGVVKATSFVDKLLAGKKEFSEYVDLFETPEDCLLSNQLVRMNQYDEDGKLKLCTIHDISDSISPF